MPRRKGTAGRFWTKYNRMKRLLVLLIIILVSGFLLAVWWVSTTQAPTNTAAVKRFVITKGASSSQIGNNLREAGLVKSSLVFKFYVQLTGNSRRIQAGEYRIPQNLSLNRLISFLLQGPTELWVTIPEGIRREEIADKFVESLELSGTEATAFRNDFLQRSAAKEGYLFPDTYLFPRDASASAVVSLLTSTFDKKVDAKMRQDLDQKDIILSQAVIVASLLERETITDQERPVVAGILIKRWRAGWPLQVDASVQYALASAKCGQTVDCNWWPRPLTGDDLEINSPYNTYKFPGLPPAPIASPGISAINGVVYYEESPYWFYLHDEDGQIHYAETLDQHNTNITRYLNR